MDRSRMNEARATGGSAQRLRRLDTRLVDDICVFAMERFGDAWWDFEYDFTDPEGSPSLFVV